MPPTANAFLAEYAAAFGRYRLERNETMLHEAYELGRAAVERELSVLDLAVVHHDVLATTLATTTAGQAEEAARAASDFFLETLSAFEMVQRGFRETREAAAGERRQAELLRRLSGFLSDASLAVSAHGSERELLQLVAEQATELIDAEYCVAAASLGDGERAVVFTASGEAGPREVPSWVAAAVDKWGIRPAGMRASSNDLRRDRRFAETFGSADDAPSLRNAVAARLVALDGTELGFVQLFNRAQGEFTEVDEAVLVHLAQMTSAALERARFYRTRADDVSR